MGRQIYHDYDCKMMNYTLSIRIAARTLFGYSDGCLPETPMRPQIPFAIGQLAFGPKHKVESVGCCGEI